MNTLSTTATTQCEPGTHQSVTYCVVYQFFVACAVFKNDVISYPKNISALKKGQRKKVQVIERLKAVKSLEEKLYTVELQHTIAMIVYVYKRSTILPISVTTTHHCTYSNITEKLA